MMFPLRDVVIIERDSTETTIGGIVLTESYKDPAGTDTGEVLSLNNAYYTIDGTWRHIEGVQTGDRVLFMRKHAIAIKGSKTQVIVRYENLLAVLEH